MSKKKSSGKQSYLLLEAVAGNPAGEVVEYPDDIAAALMAKNRIQPIDSPELSVANSDEESWGEQEE